MSLQNTCNNSSSATMSRDDESPTETLSGSFSFTDSMRFCNPPWMAKKSTLNPPLNSHFTSTINPPLNSHLTGKIKAIKFREISKYENLNYQLNCNIQFALQNSDHLNRQKKLKFCKTIFIMHGDLGFT